MNELLVPVVEQTQAVTSGNRTLNLLTEFGHLVSAVATVADITETGSVISDKMHKTMAEHIDARKADTLLSVSSMFVAYRGLLFAGTGRADVDGAKVQIKACCRSSRTKCRISFCSCSQWKTASYQQ